MNRDQQLKRKRTKFVKTTIANADEAAKELEKAAEALRHCKNTNDKIFALSQIFCVSEATITKDLYNEY